MPTFCYEKAFWIVIAFLITVGTSTITIAYSMINETKELALDNKMELEKRKEIIEQIPAIYKNQIKICEKLQADCD